MLSVDVCRGVAIVGMILVNATAYFHYAAPAPVPFFLLHAHWSGFLVADFVFPGFIFIVGVSIALSLGGQKEVGRIPSAVYRRISLRALKLILIGVLLSNLYAWYAEIDLSKMRYFGVLQRIGVVYGVTAILFLRFSPRTLAAIAGAILVCYSILLYAPYPDGAADLGVPGANIVSWVDRLMLGEHAFYEGAAGYDPEGLLSTFPAISQCLFGALLGVFLVKAERSASVAVRLGGAGACLTAAGLTTGLAHPIIKDLWTASYVLLSTGVIVLILACAFFVNDVLRRYGPVSHFFRVFGVNAIAAYVLHFVLSFLIAAAPFVALYGQAAKLLPEQAAALAPVTAFLALNWFAVLWLWRRGILIRV